MRITLSLLTEIMGIRYAYEASKLIMQISTVLEHPLIPIPMKTEIAYIIGLLLLSMTVIIIGKFAFGVENNRQQFVTFGS